MSHELIPFPRPPLDANDRLNAVTQGETVILVDLKGTKRLGSLESFDLQGASLSYINQKTHKLVSVAFEDLKLMHLPKVRHWAAAEPLGGGTEAITHPTVRQPFIVKFKDGDSLEGRSLSIRRERNGLFLFPQQAENRYICTFVPTGAIAGFDMGPRLGEVLVDQESLSKEALESALTNQEDHKEQPLGEYLKRKSVVTTKELEEAIDHQKRMPNVRLGEVLRDESFITEEQLQQALVEQQKDRGRLLGDILVERGLVNNSDIQVALSRKLGIPFLELRHFDIDPDVLALVPEHICRRFAMLPVYIYENKLVVAVQDPLAWEPLEEARFHSGMYVEPVMADAGDISQTINLAYSLLSIDEDMEADMPDPDEVQDPGEIDHTVIRLVNKVILDAYRLSASDIHLEALNEKKCQVRFRIDGSLTKYRDIPFHMRRAVVSRIKVMSDLDISDRRRPQDGKIDFRRFSRFPIELRVATVPTVGGEEDVVLRILAGGEPIPLEDLGLSPRNRKSLKERVESPFGLFLVCGPTGSGKTTTLHSLLNSLNNTENKIWTAEDPVEIRQEGLRQVQMNPKAGVDFATSLRAFLRADPDIIMVGEMRDEETVRMAIEASLTGHVVFSTLHTNSAPESVTRLLEMGMDPFNFGDALLGVLSQRLAKTLCRDCREAYQPDAKEVERLVDEYVYEHERAGLKVNRGKLVVHWMERYGKKGRLTLHRATGCKACNDTGYRGRFAVHELLLSSPAITEDIVNRSPISELTKTALAEGMRTLRQDGIEKVLQGITDLAQVNKVCAR